jgi:hypothetical protein
MFAKDAFIVMNLVVGTNLKMVKHNEMMKIYLYLYVGKPSEAVLHKEPLVYENVKLVTRL